MLPPDLKWFKPSEFKNPDMVDTAAARFLDNVRHRYGFPLFITDDARDADDAPPGASKTSLHYRGRAFDLKWIAPATKLAHFVESVVHESADMGVNYELEIVNSQQDRHIHLALQDAGRESELIVAAD